LKVVEFTSEFAGKMNFYLSAVDDLLRHSQDAPSLGIIFCKTRERVTAEYALRNTAPPIGVAEFVTALPPALVDSDPTVEQMENALSALIQRPGRLNRALDRAAELGDEDEPA